MSKTLAPSTGVTSRNPKGLKFISIVEAAYNKAGLNDKEAQRVNDTPGLSEIITNFIADNRVTDQFKDEEVPSQYDYLSGYNKPKGLTEQANLLRQLFSGLGFVNLDLQSAIEKGEVPLPQNTEGWFAIPNWMKNPKIFGASYNEAVQIVLNKIKETRNGASYNYREGQIGPKQLRQTANSEKFWKQISEEQGDPDILIVAAQFGIRHRGRSVRRAREVMLDNGSEFGLGAFAVGIMLLTHPERLMNYDDLWIDCAGDEYDDEFDNPDPEVRFGHTPYFGCNKKRVEFGTRWSDNAGEYYGSASGCVPQK